MDFRSDSKKLEPLTLFSQSSLTDIILLLLIFFLLTSSFVTNFSIRVNLPRAETSTATDPQQIIVSITDEGSYYVEGNLTQQTGLRDAIRSVHQNKPEATLVIQADEASRMGEFVDVFNIGRALNINVQIATERVAQ